MLMSAIALAVIAIVIEVPGCWLACLELCERMRRRRSWQRGIDIEVQIRFSFRRG